MTLAYAILLFGFSSVTSISSSGFVIQSAPQSTVAEPGSGTPSAHEQSPPTPAPEAAKPIPAQPTTKPAPAKPKASAAKKVLHKKKLAHSGCDPIGSNKKTADAAGTSGQTEVNSGSPPNCPPQKIVVRQGGSPDQSIQLAGGPGGDQATQKREAANQMLATTEANLKRIAGRQLSAAQQESLAQIRQFVDQAKAALSSADLERAKTLAWKAQLLSEDLVGPQK